MVLILHYIYLSVKGFLSFLCFKKIRLIISDSIENTYDALRKSWWGTPESLHLDAFGILHWIDGYKIEIVEDLMLSKNREKLYFVNLGGYDSKQFTELHRNIFVVAENAQAAKSKAVNTICEWELPHRDYLFEVDKILDVSGLLHHRIKLTPCPEKRNFEFICKYVPIVKK